MPPIDDPAFTFQAGDQAAPANGSWPDGFYLTVGYVGDVKFFGVDQDGNEFSWRKDLGWKSYLVRKDFVISTELRPPKAREYYVEETEPYTPDLALEDFAPGNNRFVIVSVEEAQ